MMLFNPLHFAAAGHERDRGDFSLEDRKLIDAVRKNCPELSAWGDLPIGIAWGSYSQDVYLLSWLEEDMISFNRTNAVEFLSYIAWHEVNGEPKWSLTPEELQEFARTKSIN